MLGKIDDSERINSVHEQAGSLLWNPKQQCLSQPSVFVSRFLQLEPSEDSLLRWGLICRRLSVFQPDNQTLL
ncbi:hypothetical protein Scep_006274 [Stephania cephalantha]|uniref:Uncharacterized protein n=1 Tax=Stephania cephalantha TaxID=152367 RepID=A0AAP0PKN7_9MAGN